MGDAGAVVTPFYDSLLVKITASAPTFETCIDRMDRALREMRIRGVKTNIPFLENVLHHSNFRSGQATTTMIDTSPELFQFRPRKDRATKLLNFLGNVIVNGNPHAKGHRPAMPLEAARLPGWDRVRGRRVRLPGGLHGLQRSLHQRAHRSAQLRRLRYSMHGWPGLLGGQVLEHLFAAAHQVRQRVRGPHHHRQHVR
jgi:acetyl/propionyl-CoA carboxylase alpha subunit